MQHFKNKLQGLSPKQRRKSPFNFLFKIEETPIILSFELKVHMCSYMFICVRKRSN